MKIIAFLAFVALAAAFDVGSYQPQQIDIRDGSIYVVYQGWNIVLKKPVDNFNYLEVFVSGPNNFNRRVIIDNHFQVVKDYYLNNDYASNYQQYYGVYNQKFGQYFGQADFNQFEYLLSIFKQYVGTLDMQHWSQFLNALQTEVQQGKVHFLLFELFKNFGVNEEFFHGKFSPEFYGPYQYQGQYKNPINKFFGIYHGQNELIDVSNPVSYYGKNYYGQDYFNRYFNGKDNKYYGQNVYGQQYDQYYGPYNQHHYGQEFYGPQKSYGQEYSRPYSSQFYGQEYQYGPYQQQYYGQQYQKEQYYPYQQYHAQYYGYPQYQGNYYGQHYGQNYQHPSFWNKFVSAY